MPDNSPDIDDLLEKLNALLTRQDQFAKEINQLREQISSLKESPSETETESGKSHSGITPGSVIISIPPIPLTPTGQRILLPENTSNPVTATLPKIKSDTERFIGENLINKIGIAITVIGVAIGAKYSIEHDLISPLTRIILAYLMGFGLMGVGFNLRKKYENFSAVLVSGAIAIMYFITYAAYSFYSLMPQLVAFALMVLFTVFTVLMAVRYNTQVIAIIGLVGAYAVPFLLSEGSGRVGILFSYIAIINFGILFIAMKKYWKILYYSSFLLTWTIYLLWFFMKYEPSLHFGLALSFLSIFFFTFYFIFLSYKLIQKEEFEFGDILFLLTNSFIFYGVGYSALDGTEANRQLLGLFTLLNAVIHFIVSCLIYRQKPVDRNLLYLVSGMVLIFITLAVPVQLDGHWVTLLWVGEAALLFWIGRMKHVPMYERLSYPLMFLAAASLFYVWLSVYSVYSSRTFNSVFTPFINVNFLTSMLFAAAFLFITITNRDKIYKSEYYTSVESGALLDFIFPAIFLGVLYFSVRLEIKMYWDWRYAGSVLSHPEFGQSIDHWDVDIKSYRIVWMINYSLLFFSCLFFLKKKLWNEKTLTSVIRWLGIITLFAFLVQGLYYLSELRDTYLEQTLSASLLRTGFNITIRYISYAFAGLFLFSFARYVKSSALEPGYNRLKVLFDLILYISIIWVATSELITRMDIMHSQQSYKLALSLLWGLYALILIILGIWKDKKHLRIAAIVLFTGTLLKLFFYDITLLSTLSKTIVFVVLGILLLIISFLYNKYTHKIT
ncbi:MAG: DUF2339 domain-containing protein [Saprospiraceae bacterium]